MTIKEWVRLFIDRFKQETGREPNPLDAAHNIPKNASDSDAMRIMVEMMEHKDD